MMKSRFAKIGRSGLLAYVLTIGWAQASTEEQREYGEGIFYKDGVISVESVVAENTEKAQTLARRIVHIAEKLQYPEDATKARTFLHEMLRSEQTEETKSKEPPSWIDGVVRNFNPLEIEETLSKMMSAIGDFSPAPGIGVGVFQAFGLDEKFLEVGDRFIWRETCGKSLDCPFGMAKKFVSLEIEGKETALMRRLLSDLGVLPTNSPKEAYSESWMGGVKYGLYTLGDIDKVEFDLEHGSENRKREGQGETKAQRAVNLVSMGEEKLGQKITREDLEERIANIPQGQMEKTQGGPLQDYRQRMKARIERAVRADIYASLGAFLSFADPELGRVVAVGFPAVERLMDGLSTILSGSASSMVALVAFGDVLGGAAALTKLVSSLAGSEDVLARNIRMIQRGLRGVSDQVRAVDRKVKYVMKRLDEVATTAARTHEEVLALALRLEEVHRETMRQSGIQRRDIRQIGRYLMDAEKNEVLDRVVEVESCVSVVEQMLLHTAGNDWVSEHLRCREKAFRLARDLATRTIYTGIDMPYNLQTYFEYARQFNAADADWIAALWREVAGTVMSAKVEALSIPTKYRGLFDERMRGAPAPRTVAMELSEMPDGPAINPVIWREGVRQYVKLEQQRRSDVPANDLMTQQLIDSAGRMKSLLKVIEEGNLAYDAMELHLWNGHLLMQVLRGLWSEYLETKLYRFTTCTKEELEEVRRGASRQSCYRKWSYGWRGNEDLVFEYWSNGYDEEHLPTSDPEKIQAMVRLLRANDGKNGVESKVDVIEQPPIVFTEDVEFASGEGQRNFVSRPGIALFKGDLVFPAIFADVGVSWTGCLRIAGDHRLIGKRHPIGTETKWLCVGDEPREYGSKTRVGQFVKGGQGLRHSFRPPPGEAEPTWCHLESNASVLGLATYEDEPMLTSKTWSPDGYAKIRAGSLVLNEIGLTKGWNKPDESYNNPAIKKDAFRLTKYKVLGTNLHGRETGSCEFYALWGIRIDEDGFFPDSLYIHERYGDPLKIEGHFTSVVSLTKQ